MSCVDSLVLGASLGGAGVVGFLVAGLFLLVLLGSR